MLVRKHLNDLLRITDAVPRQLLECFNKTAPVTVCIVVHKRSLITRLIPLFEEGKQVVDEHHPVLHLRDRARDFFELGPFIELLFGKDGGAYAVSETVHAAQKPREIVGAWVALKIVLLNPTSLEDWFVSAKRRRAS
jgi:hypothetical protein